jgi:hypothetical protein
MVCTPIYSFSAPEGYEIHPDFVSKVRELNFARGLDKNQNKHLQDFEEICATLMISGMNHETLKWKAFLFSLMGWAKQWYKLHVSSYHGCWVILKDQLCLPSSHCPRLLIFAVRFLFLLIRMERVWEQPSLDTINLLCQV